MHRSVEQYAVKGIYICRNSFYYGLLVSQAEKSIFVYYEETPLSDDNNNKKKNENVKEILPLKYPDCVPTSDSCHVTLHHSAPILLHPSSTLSTLCQFLLMFGLP